MSNTSIPSSARAWTVKGGKSAITLNSSFPVAQPAEGQILVKIAAIGVNPVDWKIAEYSFFGRPEETPIGYDGAGTVVAVGSGVTQFRVGQRVLISPPLNEHGCMAEYCTVSQHRAVQIPVGVSTTQAAAYPIAYESAYDGLWDKHLNGKWVYVPGGAGGVGHFAVQYAQAHGARVIASASQPHALYVLRDILQVDYVINYKNEDPVKRVLEITEGAGADVVYDGTYQDSSFVQSAQAVKKGGVVVYLGQGPAEDSEPAKILKERGATRGKADTVQYCTNLAEQGKKLIPAALNDGLTLLAKNKVKPYIQRVFPFEEADKAVQSMKGANVGKTVIVL